MSMWDFAVGWAEGAIIADLLIPDPAKEMQRLEDAELARLERTVERATWKIKPLLPTKPIAEYTDTEVVAAQHLLTPYVADYGGYEPAEAEHWAVVAVSQAREDARRRVRMDEARRAVEAAEAERAAEAARARDAAAAAEAEAKAKAEAEAKAKAKAEAKAAKKAARAQRKMAKAEAKKARGPTEGGETSQGHTGCTRHEGH